MRIGQTLRKRFALAAQRAENELTEECKHHREQQSDAQANQRCMQYQCIGFVQVVRPDGATHSGGNAASHRACRQHLLQHDQRKNQCHAGQGHDAQLANVPSLGNADQGGGCHGHSIGQG